LAALLIRVLSVFNLWLKIVSVLSV
jgi:hypothetical protein